MGRMRKAAGEGERGGALLAVLWLSAALSAIAFTVAITVRAELERASSALDAARAYYLAQGAIERFIYQLGFSMTEGPGEPGPGRFRQGQRRMRWELASGVVDLEIIGEGGKLNIYYTEPDILARVMVFSGVDPERARQIAAGIVARRRANVSSGSSFSSSLPSFLQLEDLLTVSGMTPDIYYGWWTRDQGRLVERGGVSPYFTLLDGGAVNANYASPVVLRAVGVPEGAIMAILAVRAGQVIDDPGRFGVGALAGGLTLAGGGSIAYTVRATAQLKGRPVRRTVAALIRFGRDNFEAPLGIVRWYAAGN